MNGVTNATAFRFLAYQAKARFCLRTVDDVRHCRTFHPARGVKCRYPDIMIRVGFAAVIDLRQYAGRVLQVKHRVAEHFPISVAGMRVIGVLDTYRPAVLQRIFDLRRDLLIRQRGQKRELTLRDDDFLHWSS